MTLGEIIFEVDIRDLKPEEKKHIMELIYNILTNSNEEQFILETLKTLQEFIPHIELFMQDDVYT